MMRNETLVCICQKSYIIDKLVDNHISHKVPIEVDMFSTYIQGQEQLPLEMQKYSIEMFANFDGIRSH